MDDGAAAAHGSDMGERASSQVRGKGERGSRLTRTKWEWRGAKTVRQRRVVRAKANETACLFATVARGNVYRMCWIPLKAHLDLRRGRILETGGGGRGGEFRRGEEGVSKAYLGVPSHIFLRTWMWDATCFLERSIPFFLR